MFSPDGTLISASAAPHCGRGGGQGERGRRWREGGERDRETETERQRQTETERQREFTGLHEFTRKPHFGDICLQRGAADAKIEVPSGENTELKRSPFKSWSSSVYSHTCYAYCSEFLPCLFLTSGPFTCIFLFPKPLPIFPLLAVANTWFLCKPLWLTGFKALTN